MAIAMLTQRVSGLSNMARRGNLEASALICDLGHEDLHQSFVWVSFVVSTELERYQSKWLLNHAQSCGLKVPQQVASEKRTSFRAPGKADTGLESEVDIRQWGLKWRAHRNKYIPILDVLFRNLPSTSQNWKLDLFPQLLKSSYLKKGQKVLITVWV